MQDDRKSLGKWGEEQSCSFLEADGYRILRRNYKCRIGEIDIIARKGEQLVFVEVKTRRTASYGRPGEAVNYRKQAKLTGTALYFLNDTGWKDVSCRFDVLEVKAQSDGTFLINHIEDAFQAATGKYYY
ncbi:MAG TPA: YraN family protein [Clostridiales bacterium]|nr:YraN family protein [Clostridia bacterium]MDD4680024.1 YraN family protein [Clostridia bacterium]HCS74067.1 YraN family protein [Clostridiales bacterium]